MQPKVAALCMLASLAVTFCTGCATNYSEIVRFTPSEPWDKRTSSQLQADVNAIMPFEIASGDFVANKGFDGPSCWVCLGDEKKTAAFVKILRDNPEWKVTAISQVKTTCRPMFGLAPEPGMVLAGRTATEQPLFADRRSPSPAMP